MFDRWETRGFGALNFPLITRVFTGTEVGIGMRTPCIRFPRSLTAAGRQTTTVYTLYPAGPVV